LKKIVAEMCTKKTQVHFKIYLSLLTNWDDAINVFLVTGVQTAIAVLDLKGE